MFDGVKKVMQETNTPMKIKKYTVSYQTTDKAWHSYNIEDTMEPIVETEDDFVQIHPEYSDSEGWAYFIEINRKEIISWGMYPYVQGPKSDE